MKKTIQRLRNERGLTLVELLAVIVILAIIAVIAFVFIGGVIENSKKDAHIANAQQIISAAKLHEATGGEIGTGGVSAEFLQKGDYLDQVLNPWTKEQYDDLDKVIVNKVEAQQGADHKYDYKITFPSGDASRCNITEKSEVELSGDRDSICD